MNSETLEAIIKQCAIAKLALDAMQRRCLGRPGHQNASPQELLTKARTALDDIDRLLRRDERMHEVQS